MDWAALFKTFVEWFPDRNKVMLAFSLISALLLFLPWRVLLAMHIEKFADAYRSEEWLVFLFCSSILIAEGIHAIWRYFHANRKLDKRLQQMTTPELGVVVRILRGEQMNKWPHENGVETLHQDGILWREPTAWDNGQFVYGLEKTARERAIALGIGKK